jgi:PiT family inorganic phosphate transporter
MALHFLDGSLGAGTVSLLLLALAIALGFEFINGFHDTANAVATVIYTRSLRPHSAVLWSGFCNFCGVYLGGTAVAFSIVHLLPVDLLVRVGSSSGLAMVLALLIAAMTWNFGTWYLGLPASSSHTLIGSILGIGLANSLLPGHAFGRGVNWHAAQWVGLSLLLSPLAGFTLAYLLLRLCKSLIRHQELYEPPTSDSPPPGWIRGVLIFTCTGVSFAHGSNDGQKGVGLIMLILIGVVPAHYVLDESLSPAQLRKVVRSVEEIEELLDHRLTQGLPDELVPRLADVRQSLQGLRSLRELSPEDRRRLRVEVLEIDRSLADWGAREVTRLASAEQSLLKARRSQLRGLIDYAPSWVLVAVATALGVGTTVGWKRIVKTVGEKIGKTHLTYAQGACAELVAMSTIGLADYGGLPVSTTHVLASGVAGTMAANRSGLQSRTVRNILLAWVLTLPATIALSGLLFLLFRLLVRG